jgi:hypothetical protein
MRNANVFFHTYDSKSGAPIRITRIGATKARVLEYANATDFKMSLDPLKAQEACEKAGLDLVNPPGKEHWYHPYRS